MVYLQYHPHQLAGGVTWAIMELVVVGDHWGGCLGGLGREYWLAAKVASTTASLLQQMRDKEGVTAEGFQQLTHCVHGYV